MVSNRKTTVTYFGSHLASLRHAILIPRQPKSAKFNTVVNLSLLQRLAIANLDYHDINASALERISRPEQHLPRSAVPQGGRGRSHARA